MSDRHWRRFLPKRRSAVVKDNGALSTIKNVVEAEAFINQLRAQIEPNDRTARNEWLRTLVIAQTPRAALAQQQMDAHRHGYHNREERLYELIDFNDTFVSYVLSIQHAELPGLAERLRKDMTEFCQRLNTPMFSPEQFDAIVRGLSREIAVYRGAKHEGFKARMTSRTDDAFGIDMVITDQASGKELNIDCKTPPAFRHRLEDLLHDGRITEDQLLKADEANFMSLDHRRNEERVPVTLFCVQPDTLGDIHDFNFDDTEPLGRLLRTIFLTLP